MGIELKDLVIRKRYSVKLHTETEVFEDIEGNYEAESAKDIRKALVDKEVPNGVLVKIGRSWFPIKRDEDKHRQYRKPYNYSQRRRRLKSKFITIITDGLQNNLSAEIIAIKLLKIPR